MTVHQPSAFVQHGRLVLLGVIILGFLVSSLEILMFMAQSTLRWEVTGGGKEAIEYIVSNYSSVLGIIGAYYFSERRSKQRRPASRDALIFSLIVTILASLSPPVVLYVLAPTYDALQWLRSFATFTQALFAGAITYYFARGVRDDPPSSLPSTLPSSSAAPDAARSAHVEDGGATEQ